MYKSLIALQASYNLSIFVLKIRKQNIGGLMHKKKWTRPECGCCHHFNEECKQGACFWIFHKRKVIRKDSG